MNRVRIVAITAVVLGGVVIAGTRFQQAREAAALASLPADAPATASRPLALASAAEAPLSLIATSNSAPAAAPAPVSEPARALVTASVLPGLTPSQPWTSGHQPLTPVDAPATQASASPSDTETPAELPADLQAELEACSVWLVVTPSPSAMLETSVYAPCDAGAQVQLSHAGLRIDTRLGADGQLQLQMPALNSDATVTLTFADGRVQSDRTRLDDLNSVERIVLQWQAPVELDLHAYEFGAEFGRAGHVYAGAPHWSGNPGEGFLTVLGDPTIPAAALAEVYTYPRAETSREGQVALEIEIPVTPASCGGAVTASTIELHGTASAQVRTFRLDMPACDGAGGFVILPGVLPELQIASN